MTVLEAKVQRDRDGRGARIETVKVRAVKRDRDGLIRCRVCGCTERDPCNPPCAWAEHDLCTTCSEAAASLCIWREGARRPSFAALVREFSARWNADFAVQSRHARGARR